MSTPTAKVDVSTLIHPSKVSQLRRMFKGRCVGRAEFVMLLMSMQAKEVARRSEEELALVRDLSELFDLIDSDGSGEVSWAETTSFLVAGGMQASVQTHKAVDFSFVPDLMLDEASVRDVKFGLYIPPLRCVAMVEEGIPTVNLLTTEGQVSAVLHVGIPPSNIPGLRRARSSNATTGLSEGAQRVLHRREEQKAQLDWASRVLQGDSLDPAARAKAARIVASAKGRQTAARRRDAHTAGPKPSKPAVHVKRRPGSLLITADVMSRASDSAKAAATQRGWAARQSLRVSQCSRWGKSGSLPPTPAPHVSTVAAFGYKSPDVTGVLPSAVEYCTPVRRAPAGLPPRAVAEFLETQSPVPMLAVATTNFTIGLWLPHKDFRFHSSITTKEPPTLLRWCPSLNVLLTTGPGMLRGCLLGYDLLKGELLLRMDAHDGMVSDVLDLGHGMVATGGMDRLVRLWGTGDADHVTTLIPSATLRAHMTSVRRLVYSKQYNLLVSTACDTVAIVWNPDTQLLMSRVTHRTTIVDAAVLPMVNDLLLTLDCTNTIRVSSLVVSQSVRHATALQIIEPPDSGVAFTCIIPMQDCVHFLALGRRRVCFHPIPIDKFRDAPSDVAYNFYSASFFVAVGQTVVEVDAVSGLQKASHSHLSEGTLLPVVCDGRGRKFVSGDTKGVVSCHSVTTGACMREANCLGGAEVSAMAYHNQDALIVAAVGANIFVFDDGVNDELETLRVVHDAHSVPLTCLALSPELSLIATGAADGTARLWDLQSCRQTADLTGHTADITCVQFTSPAAVPVVFTGDSAGKVIMWACRPHTAPAVALATWDLPPFATSAHAIKQDTAGTACMAVLFADGHRKLVTGDTRGRVMVWDLATVVDKLGLADVPEADWPANQPSYNPRKKGEVSMLPSKSPRGGGGAPQSPTTAVPYVAVPEALADATYPSAEWFVEVSGARMYRSKATPDSDSTGRLVRRVGRTTKVLFTVPDHLLARRLPQFTPVSSWSTGAPLHQLRLAHGRGSVSIVTLTGKECALWHLRGTCVGAVYSVGVEDGDSKEAAAAAAVPTPWLFKPDIKTVEAEVQARAHALLAEIFPDETPTLLSPSPRKLRRAPPAPASPSPGVAVEDSSPPFAASSRAAAAMVRRNRNSLVLINGELAPTLLQVRELMDGDPDGVVASQHPRAMRSSTGRVGGVGGVRETVTNSYPVGPEDVSPPEAARPAKSSPPTMYRNLAFEKRHRPLSAKLKQAPPDTTPSEFLQKRLGLPANRKRPVSAPPRRPLVDVTAARQPRNRGRGQLFSPTKAVAQEDSIDGVTDVSSVGSNLWPAAPMDGMMKLGRDGPAPRPLSATFVADAAARTAILAPGMEAAPAPRRRVRSSPVQSPKRGPSRRLRAHSVSRLHRHVRSTVKKFDNVVGKRPAVQRPRSASVAGLRHGGQGGVYTTAAMSMGMSWEAVLRGYDKSATAAKRTQLRRALGSVLASRRASVGQ